jgi:hypothetical protein
MHVDLLHRAVPVERTPEGLRAVSKGRPIAPESVQRYLEGRFGAELGAVERAMNVLARSLPADELEASAYRLYEAFRPEVPAGVRGWGAAGVLDLQRIRNAAQ